MSLEDLKNIPYGKTAIELKNIFLAFFLIFTFANNALAESFYFKKCDFSENYIV